MDNQNIRIRLRGYDNSLLDSSTQDIINTAKRTGAKVKGPIPLPKKKRRWCLLKSPHVNKKSREHFEATTYSRIIDVHIEIDKIDQYGKDLCKIGLPSGVRMELRNSIS